MAVNPLFSSVSSSVSKNSMNKDFYNRGAGEPPDKRQKIHTLSSDQENNLWDSDDFEITDEQMVDMEIMASQAMTSSQINAPTRPTAQFNSNHRSNGNTSKRLVQGNASVKPSGTTSFTRQTNVKDSGLIGGGNSVKTGGKVHANIMGGMHLKSAGDSGYMSQGFTSRSKVQSNVNTMPVADTSKGGASRQQSVPARGSGSVSPALPSSHGKSDFTEILQKEVAKLKEEVQRLRKDHCGREGEIKILRDKLHQKETDLYSQKQEKVHLIDQHFRERNEKDKVFERERDRMSTQLQFKEQELLEAQSQFRSLEQKLRQSKEDTQSTLGYAESSESSSKVSPKMKSPKFKRLKVERSPKGSNFPTSQSFLADERAKLNSLSKMDSSMTSSKGTDTCDLIGTDRAHNVKEEHSELHNQINKLKISMPKGEVTGAHLVSTLLSKDGEQSLLLLFSEPLIKFDYLNLKQQRKQAGLPSPKKIQSPQIPYATMNPGCSHTIVKETSRIQALDAMSSLLSQKELNKKGNSDIPRLPMSNELLFTFAGESQTTIDRAPDSSNLTSDAVNFLPVINDYLTAYLDCLQNSDCLQKSGSDGGKMGTSLEHGSTSLEDLIIESRIYANNLEKRTLTALSVLETLVHYSCAVAKSLANMELCTPNHVVSELKGKEVITMETRDEPGPSSRSQLKLSCKKSQPRSGQSSATEKGAHLSLSSIGSSSTGCLTKTIINVVLILSKDKNNDSTAVSIADKCLDVLVAVAEGVDKATLTGFEAAFKVSDLLAVLDVECGFSLLKRVLRLLTVLGPSNQFVSRICTQNDDCLLLAIYSMCCHQFKNIPPGGTLDLYSRILHFLYIVTSYHKGGVTLLLESDCHCSVEFIKSVILMLNSQLEVYRDLVDENHKNVGYADWFEDKYEMSASKPQGTVSDLRRFLRQGILFLHLLSLHSSVFSDHHFEVEHQYVNLICGMRSVYKEFKDVSEYELNAIHDLWDFDQDDPDSTKEEDDNDGSESNRNDETVAMDTK